MSSSMDAELLDSDMGLEYDLHESDFGDDGLEEGSEEEEDDEAMDEPLIAARKDGDMIESYDRRELISNEVSSYMEPVEGMEFDSEECARAFYASYARHAGFRVRSSKSRRSVGDGAVVCRQFVCSREGFYMERPQGGGREQAEVIAGVGCMARLVVRRQPSGRWVVSKFEREHNHDPLENVALRKVDLRPLQASEMKKVEGSLQQAESPPEKSAVFASPCGNPELEPYEGMEFSSEEAARAFYYTYAKDMGFTVRISKCRRARDGSIVCRRFVCSKEGYYVRKYGRTKRSRALTRVGCLARLIVKKLDSGVWVVTNFDKEHNHPPFVQGTELTYEPPKPARRINRGARLTLESPALPALSKPEADLQGSQSPVSWRFSKLHQEGIKFAEEGSSSVEVFNVAMFALREASQKVIAAKSGVLRAPQTGNDGQHSWPNDPGNQQGPNEVFVQKQRSDENGSASLSTSAAPRKKRRLQTGDDGEQFGPNAVQEQDWDPIPVSNAGLSEAQVAALQAVAEAFSVPTLGSTSSSALPVKVSPVSGEADASRRYGEFQEVPRTPGPNPLVHAAAIAAGARIASPEVAASLIRAVQSRAAVHIRAGASSLSKPPAPPPPSAPPRGGEPFAGRSPGTPQHPNSHYIRAGDSLLPPPVVGVQGGREVHVGASEGGEMQELVMDGEMNARAMAELEAAAAAVAAHSSLMQHHHVAEQQHAGSAIG